MSIFKQLSAFNRITFVEKTHSYLIDDQPTGAPSVTQLLKRFKRPFDKESASKRVAKKTGQTAQQILAEWEMNKLYSTTLGSMFHKYVENFYCNKKIGFEGNFDGLGFEEKAKIGEKLPKMVEQFQQFYKENAFLHCVKNEMVVGDIEDTKVCGMLDMLCWNEQTDKYEILDFKTNKKMTKVSEYGVLFYPFEHMTEGEINEYTIQLNTYKYLIEKYTPITIDKLKLVWFNAANEKYQIFELGDIQRNIKLMFDVFKSTSLFGGQ